MLPPDAPGHPVECPDRVPVFFAGIVTRRLERKSVPIRELARRIGRDASGLCRKLNETGGNPSFDMLRRVSLALDLDDATIAAIVRGFKSAS